MLDLVPQSPLHAVGNYGYKTVVMIRDGATDREARQPGGADLFICYAGVQMRETVTAEADWVVFDFQELITKSTG
nr:unnamed protein product [Digitaria exilis]